MEVETKTSAFTRYAWIALGYNLVVILWGVFLRASYSGDGCGQHWLTCQGEAIPSAPQLKTAIEFSHRITTMLAGFVVVGLLIWAYKKFPKGHAVRFFALLSFVFIVIEGAIGGGLVLTGNTAANWTPSRPYWTAGHLINTFILIAFLSLTAWFSNGRKQPAYSVSTRTKLLIVAGAAAIFLAGISGSMAALTNMLFPSESIAEGIARDFDPDSDILLRLRILHPILSIATAVFLFFIAGWLKRMNPNRDVTKWSNAVSILVLVQVAFGAATLLLLAPIVMQLGHLLLADLIWIAFVLMSASVLYSSEQKERAETRSL